MTTFLLERFSNHPQMGVFGTLITPTTVLNTVEQPWNDNTPNKSCVPDGIYTLHEVNSPRWGKTLALVGGTVALDEASVLKGEAARWGCLFHQANFANELKGCIAPGLGLGAIGNGWVVKSSKLAMDRLLSEAHHGDTLIISWAGVFCD
jgi:hypothetical protein